MADNSPLSLIVYEAQTQSRTSDGGTGSSNTRSTILERSIGTRDGGLELEYSFPTTDIPENDAWKLPARVFTKPGSSVQLLNENEIEERLEDYLEKYPEIRAHCGEVVFTWTAFEIHCSSSHVIDLVESYNLHIGPLAEGNLYEEPGALSPAPMHQISSASDNLVFQVELVLDPKNIQEEFEDSMEQVAQITGDSASSIMNSSWNLAGDEKPKFSGTRLVTIEGTSTGLVVELRRETTLRIVGGGTFQETHTQIEILKRQSVESGQ